MKRFAVLAIGALVAAVTMLWLAGCASTGGGGKHQVVSQSDDYVIGCQKCYDEAVRVRRASANGQKWRRFQTIKKHMCPGCKGEMVSYTEDGTPMIKCEGCTPEGVPCDRCLPPKSGA